VWHHEEKGANSHDDRSSSDPGCFVVSPSHEADEEDHSQSTDVLRAGDESRLGTWQTELFLNLEKSYIGDTVDSETFQETEYHRPEDEDASLVGLLEEPECRKKREVLELIFYFPFLVLCG